MPSRPPPHGLRVTVRLHGVTLAQAVHWPGAGPVDIGAAADEAVPTPADGGLGRATWRAPDRVEIAGAPEGLPSGPLAPGDVLHWAQGDVSVDVDLIPRADASRRPTEPAADLALAVFMLMLVVGVGQARLVVEALFPDAAQRAATSVAEPSPELIARLLKKELDGADDGAEERAVRPEFERGVKSFYMPSGNEGPIERTGGGATAGPEVQRPPEAPPEDLPPAPAPAPDAAPEPAAAPPDAPAPAVEAPPLATAADAPVLLAEAERPPTPPAPPAAAPPPVQGPMERFIGWGFRDWYEVEDARPEVNRDIARQLEAARRRLKLDPDDPGALNVVGYYAYLAQNWELGQATYQRLVDLYPEAAAGYNNLALTYKRQGRYAEEEALYRKGLAIEPDDTHILNNLAVNLSHQGRHDEALEIMGRLEQLSPEDPYADLHRAKIYAALGKEDKAFRFLKKALEAVAVLDTMHHIEFRADIRLDPAFDPIRAHPRFRRILEEHYGPEAGYLLGEAPRGRSAGG